MRKERMEITIRNELALEECKTKRRGKPTPTAPL
jgi:hypothetical protein